VAGVVASTQSDEVTTPPSPKYWAFISYSQRDKKWGQWLVHALETYRIPKQLVGKTIAAGVVPPRLTPVFRDRDELSGAADLSEKIHDALAQSRTLIVICSPNAARSQWVDKEVVGFKSAGRESRVLTLVVDGEPNATDAALECFPRAVRYRVDASGEITQEPSEPLAADAREQGDGKRNALLKLIAGILGVDYDALRQRDHERRIRRLWFGGAVAAAAAAIFLGLALYANSQRLTANERASVALSRQLAAQSQIRLAAQPDLALLLGAEASFAADTSEGRSALVASLVNRPGLVRTLHGVPSYVSRPAVGADGKTLALAACSRWTGKCDTPRLLVWDLDSGARLRDISLEHAAFAVAISPDGKVLASGGCAKGVDRGCEEAEIRLWDLSTGQARAHPLAASGCEEPVVDLAFAGNDGLISRCDDLLVTWDVKTGRERARRQLDSGDVAAFSATAAGDSLVSLMRASSTVTTIWRKGEVDGPGEPVFPGARREISSAAISPDGKTVAIGACAVESIEGFCNRGEIRMWDVAAGKEKGAPFGDFDDWVRSLAFSPDGLLLASGGCGKRIDGRCVEGELRLWDEDGQEVGSRVAAHTADVANLAFVGNAGTLVSAADNGTLMVWSTPAGGPTQIAETDGMMSAALVRSVRSGRAFGYSGVGGYVPALAFNSSGTMAAVNACEDRRRFRCPEYLVDIWNEGAKEPKRIRPRFVGVAALAFSPDARLLAIGGCRQSTGEFDEERCVSGEIEIWDVTTQRRRGTPLRAPGTRITALAFSPDGKLLASAECPMQDLWSCDSTAVRLWDIDRSESRVPPVSFGDLPVSALTFAPDGRALVVGGCPERGLLEESKRCHATEIRILSTATLNQIGPSLTHQSQWITALAVDASGRTLAAGAVHGDLMLWDLSDGQELGALRGHMSDVVRIAWMPDGSLESRDGRTTFLWHSNPESWRAQACAMANRSFTCAEWQQYFGEQPYRPVCSVAPVPSCGAR